MQAISLLRNNESFDIMMIMLVLNLFFMVFIVSQI